MFIVANFGPFCAASLARSASTVCKRLGRACDRFLHRVRRLGNTQTGVLLGQRQFGVARPRDSPFEGRPRRF